MLCCGLCSYQTKFPSWLRKHSVVHEEDRKFICETCSAAFKNLSALNLHRATHRDNVYKCGLCSFACKHKRTLDRHLVVHTDEKPYKCPHCMFRGRREQDVKVHIRCMHTGKPRRKRREEAVAELLNALSLPFDREFTIRIVAGPRKAARVDFKIEMPWGWLVLEVDEMQHSQYPVSYECSRMAAIYTEFAREHEASRLHIVRYNPDPWRQGCAIVKPSSEERANMLRAALEFVPDTNFAITFLYYRGGGDSLPDIVDHPDFALKEHVLPQRCIEDMVPIVRAETT